MEKANKKIILISIFLALITAVLIYVYMSKQETPEIKVEYATVYVAAKTMPARYKITDADIKQVKIAKELLNPNALSDTKEITGKLTMERIIAGEQIIKERLADEEGVLLSYSLPKGTRAISVNVNEQISVTSLMRPGDYVDVVVSFEKEESDNGLTAKVYPRITKTLLQNVKVLALGQDMTLPVDKLKDLPSTVTLAILESDVEKFIYASEYGMIRLALRPIGDDTVKSTAGAVREDVMGSKGAYTAVSQSGSGNTPAPAAGK